MVPYVVEVDRLGQALAAVPATQNYTPGDPQIAWHLARFIKNVRSVALDPVLMREAWLAAYDFADDRGARFLDEYARENDPFAEIGNRSVSVQVTSALRASARSFQLQWTERHYQHGSLARTERWTTILTFDVRPPRSVDVLRKNPLGLYVTAIDWNRELELESAGPPAQGTARAGDQVVAKALGIQPTLTVRPGWPLRVLVHEDLILSPWEGGKR